MCTVLPLLTLIFLQLECLFVMTERTRKKITLLDFKGDLSGLQKKLFITIVWCKG